MISKKERFKLVTDYFLKHRPVAETELQYADPYELIVAVMLSAQCTDKRVNIITPAFFRQFPSVESLALAEEKNVLELVKSCSYPNSKTRHLIKMARMLIEKFNGIMPSGIEQLQELPGVGRKTANVIASVIFNKPVMPVDTHVFRVSARIGLTTNAKTPLETEKQLIKYFPDHLIPIAHHWLILHGRYVCQAKKPKCDKCGLIDFCRYFEQQNTRKEKKA